MYQNIKLKQLHIISYTSSQDLYTSMRQDIRTLYKTHNYVIWYAVYKRSFRQKRTNIYLCAMCEYQERLSSPSVIEYTRFDLLCCFITIYYKISLQQENDKEKNRNFLLPYRCTDRQKSYILYTLSRTLYNTFFTF